jgi:alpha-glucosidase
MIVFAAALPGSLYLYQGEELGLPEVLEVPADRRQDPIFARTEGREIGRDGCRIPLPWTADAETAFGFSASNPHRTPWLPQPAGWGAYAASSQVADRSSTLTLYRDVLRARRALDPSAPLAWQFNNGSNGDDLVAFTRGDMLIVLNVSDHAVLLPAALGVVEVIVSSQRMTGSATSIGPNASAWLRTS